MLKLSPCDDTYPVNAALASTDAEVIKSNNKKLRHIFNGKLGSI